MPTQTSLAVAQGATVRYTDHNKLVTDTASLFASVSGFAQSTATATYTGRKLTAVTTAIDKFIINWSGLNITSIQYQNPIGSTVATYTPTYTGQTVTSWTKS